MRKIILAAIALIALSTPSFAATCGVSSLQSKDNSGTTANVAVVDAGDSSGNCVFKIDPQVHTDLNAAIPAGTNTIGGVFGFSAQPTATVTRPGNTTTYTANTGWCNATSACATVFTFSNACRINGGSVLVPEIDIWSSANQSTKLQGVLWLFTTTPGTIINDDATFTIAAADFANLTGNQNGFAFTMASAQSSGNNAGVSLTGTTYHAQCGAGTTTLIGMVQVVNAYVPLSAEVLHVTLHTVGAN